MEKSIIRRPNKTIVFRFLSFNAIKSSFTFVILCLSFASIAKFILETSPASDKWFLCLTYGKETLCTNGS